MNSNTPKYLRFVQTLALASSMAGCSSSMLRVDDGSVALDAAPQDTSVRVDTATLPDTQVADSALTCNECTCGNFFGYTETRPECSSVGLSECCFAVGPMSTLR